MRGTQVKRLRRIAQRVAASGSQPLVSSVFDELKVWLSSLPRNVRGRELRDLEDRIANPRDRT